jgi:hypothetical protein
MNWTAEQWLDVLAQAPCQMALLDTAAQNWTQALMRQYLMVYHQIHLSQSALSKSWRRVGLRWQGYTQRFCYFFSCVAFGEEIDYLSLAISEVGYEGKFIEAGVDFVLASSPV